MPTDTDIMQYKISQMANRIRQLEDALQISHGMISTEPHPLLTEVSNDEEQPRIKKESSDSEDTIDTHGTLAMLGQGNESYVGTDVSHTLLDHRKNLCIHGTVRQWSLYVHSTSRVNYLIIVLHRIGSVVQKRCISQ